MEFISFPALHEQPFPLNLQGDTCSDYSAFLKQNFFRSITFQMLLILFFFTLNLYPVLIFACMFYSTTNHQLSSFSFSSWSVFLTLNMALLFLVMNWSHLYCLRQFRIITPPKNSRISLDDVLLASP